VAPVAEQGDRAEQIVVRAEEAEVGPAKSGDGVKVKGVPKVIPRRLPSKGAMEAAVDAVGPFALGSAVAFPAARVAQPDVTELV
jgi:hypothetical protein